jgi:hypothetical protein
LENVLLQAALNACRKKPGLKSRPFHVLIAASDGGVLARRCNRDTALKIEASIPCIINLGHAIAAIRNLLHAITTGNHWFQTNGPTGSGCICGPTTGAAHTGHETMVPACDPSWHL